MNGDHAFVTMLIEYVSNRRKKLNIQYNNKFSEISNFVILIILATRHLNGNLRMLVIVRN
jgi:hypothetical protein